MTSTDVCFRITPFGCAAWCTPSSGDGAASIVELFACGADLPILENFAYGDTPTRAAVTAVVDELLAAGPAFDVSLADLSARHDIRLLGHQALLPLVPRSRVGADVDCVALRTLGAFQA